MKSYIKLFSNRIVATLTFSLLVSTIGGAIYNIVLLMLAKQLPFKNIAITLVSIVSMAPAFLQIIPAKIAAKRKNKYNALIISRTIQGLLYVLLYLINADLDWNIFGIILLVNLLSDSLGIFNTSINYVLQKRYVDSELLQNLIGLDNVISMFIALFGQSIGIFIYTTTHDFRLVALINAITFFIAAIIIKLGEPKNVAKKEAEFAKQAEKSDHQENHGQNDSNVTINKEKQESRFKGIFSEVTGLSFYIGLFTLTMINIIGAGLEPIINLVLADKNILFQNYGLSLLLFNTLVTIGYLLGSMANFKFISKLSFKNLVLILIVTLLFFILNILLLQNGFILLMLIFILYFLIAKSAPMLFAGIISKSEEEELPVIMAKLETVLSSAAPIGTITFPIIYVALGINYAFIAFLLVMIANFILVIYSALAYNKSQA